MKGDATKTVDNLAREIQRKYEKLHSSIFEGKNDDVSRLACLFMASLTEMMPKIAVTISGTEDYRWAVERALARWSDYISLCDAAEINSLAMLRSLMATDVEKWLVFGEGADEVRLLQQALEKAHPDIWNMALDFMEEIRASDEYRRLTESIISFFDSVAKEEDSMKVTSIAYSLPSDVTRIAATAVASLPVTVPVLSVSVGANTVFGNSFTFGSVAQVLTSCMAVADLKRVAKVAVDMEPSVEAEFIQLESPPLSGSKERRLLIQPLRERLVLEAEDAKMLHALWHKQTARVIAALSDASVVRDLASWYVQFDALCTVGLLRDREWFSKVVERLSFVPSFFNRIPVLGVDWNKIPEQKRKESKIFHVAYKCLETIGKKNSGFSMEDEIQAELRPLIDEVYGDRFKGNVLETVSVKQTSDSLDGMLVFMGPDDILAGLSESAEMQVHIVGLFRLEKENGGSSLRLRIFKEPLDVAVKLSEVEQLFLAEGISKGCSVSKYKEGDDVAVVAVGYISRLVLELIKRHLPSIQEACVSKTIEDERWATLFDMSGPVSDDERVAVGKFGWIYRKEIVGPEDVGIGTGPSSPGTN